MRKPIVAKSITYLNF